MLCKGGTFERTIMQYRRFIQDYFLIDRADTGALVPLTFNAVQNRYYDELVRDYDLEKKGVQSAVRDIILKARREGFSSLILAIFAADDILQENPTETQAVSYRDDATKAFYKRYRLFVTSYFEKKGLTEPRQMFSVDNGHELVLRHNGARFFCGTASARVAGRGGVLQKLLYSEAAHYPDTDLMTAREIIDGTMRQVDIHSGLIFMETTANGYGNYYEQTWSAAQQGHSRFKPRFYGWRDFYSQEEYDLIASEFTDKQMLKQEYPETPQDAFIASGSSYFDNEKIVEYIKKAIEPLYRGTIEMLDGLPTFKEYSFGELLVWEKPQPYASYVIGGDVAEGLEGGDYSTLYVINNRTMKVAARYRAHVRPDHYSKVAHALGYWYNVAYMAIEANKDGLWVNIELMERLLYPNLYFREAIDDITHRVGRQVGWITSEPTRRFLVEGLQKLLHDYPDIWLDSALLEECLVFVRDRRGKPEAMSGKNDDLIFAAAIAYEVRRNSPQAFTEPQDEPQTPENAVKRRLEWLYGNRGVGISQDDYL